MGRAHDDDAVHPVGYIDRQVLAALSPTVLADTGMTASDLGGKPNIQIGAVHVMYIEQRSLHFKK